MRYGMIIDLDRCIGCDACSISCKQANGTPKGIFWSRVERTEVGVFPNASEEYKPVLCMHCSNPACVDRCPTGASYRTKEGIVLVDYDVCIGCCHCIAACPYAVRNYDYGKRESYFPGQPQTDYEAYYDHIDLNRKVVNKCTLCEDRLRKGDKPACAHTCPTDARIFGDIDSPEMKKIIMDNNGYQDKVGYGTDPSVYYLPRREYKYE